MLFVTNKSDLQVSIASKEIEVYNIGYDIGNNEFMIYQTQTVFIPSYIYTFPKFPILHKGGDVYTNYSWVKSFYGTTQGYTNFISLKNIPSFFKDNITDVTTIRLGIFIIPRNTKILINEENNSICSQSIIYKECKQITNITEKEIQI